VPRPSTTERGQVRAYMSLKQAVLVLDTAIQVHEHRDIFSMAHATSVFAQIKRKHAISTMFDCPIKSRTKVFLDNSLQSIFID
jgi:hypothetical protein